MCFTQVGAKAQKYIDWLIQEKSLMIDLCGIYLQDFLCYGYRIPHDCRDLLRPAMMRAGLRGREAKAYVAAIFEKRAAGAGASDIM
jgi:hypothetical protein